jgi:hypothetical protein
MRMGLLLWIGGPVHGSSAAFWICALRMNGCSEGYQAFLALDTIGEEVSFLQ